MYSLLLYEGLKNTDELKTHYIVLKLLFMFTNLFDLLLVVDRDGPLIQYSEKGIS